MQHFQHASMQYIVRCSVIDFIYGLVIFPWSGFVDFRCCRKKLRWLLISRCLFLYSHCNWLEKKIFIEAGQCNAIFSLLQMSKCIRSIIMPILLMHFFCGMLLLHHLDNKCFPFYMQVCIILLDSNQILLRFSVHVWVLFIVMWNNLRMHIKKNQFALKWQGGTFCT
jgi:hypothetical protein